MHSPQPSPGARRTRAFTLIELAISMVIVSVLMVALGSSMVLLSRSAPQSASASSAAGRASASSAVDQIAADLQYATGVSEATATAVTFTVADRDKDGDEEKIRYAWAGSKGDPITRVYNGGTPVTVVPGVGSFALGYDRLKVTDSKSEKTETTSNEVLLADFSGWAVLPSVREMQVTATTWECAKFVIDAVSLPASTTAVQVTKVRFQARKPASGAANFSVGIHAPVAAGSAFPASAPIGTPALVPLTALGASQAWIDVPFSDVVSASAATDFVIVIKGVGGNGAIVRYLYSVLAPVDSTVFGWSGDSGGSWGPTATLLAQNDMPFEVYGKYTTSSTTTVTADSYFLRVATIAVEPASNAALRAETSVRALNEPSIPAP